MLFFKNDSCRQTVLLTLLDFCFLNHYT